MVGRFLSGMSIVTALAIFNFTGAIEKASAGDGLPDLRNVRVAMVIAPGDFRDEELKYPYKYLKKAGADIVLACTTKEKVKGMLGTVVKPEMRVGSLKVKDLDGVIFVGGSGTKTYFDNKRVLKFARDAYKAETLIGAICLAPGILAKADLLEGKRVTCYDSISGMVEQAGARYISEKTVQDGRIITGSGPEAAEKFGKAYVLTLSRFVKEKTGGGS